MNKKEKKARLEAIKERFRAVRKGMRDDELKAHNGKPFTSPNLPAVKTKYNRKKNKYRRDDYEY